MKICISRIDRMGDMILSLPAIKSIRENNINTEITILASNRNSKVLKDIQYIDKVIDINTNSNFTNFLKYLFFIRKKKYDIFINLSPTFLSYFFCYFSKSKNKATLIFSSRYKKKLFPKFFIKLISKFFCNYIYFVNRFEKLKFDEEIHQTKMIFNLLEKCNIKSNTNTKIEINLPNKKLETLQNKKIIVLHIPDKWINIFYNEDNFLKLLELIPKEKYNCALTSDNTTNKKFIKIFSKYKIINNHDFNKIKIINDNVLIFDKLNFKNWLSILYSADIVITPECGCSHLSAAAKVPVNIIYDPQNLPDAINKEYAPWNSIYKKFVFNDNNLNQNLVNTLN